MKKIIVKAKNPKTKFIKAPAKTTAIRFEIVALSKDLGSSEFSSSPSIATYPPTGRALKL